MSHALAFLGDGSVVATDKYSPQILASLGDVKSLVEGFFRKAEFGIDGKLYVVAWDAIAIPPESQQWLECLPGKLNFTLLGRGLGLLSENERLRHYLTPCGTVKAHHGKILFGATMAVGAALVFDNTDPQKGLRLAAKVKGKELIKYDTQFPWVKKHLVSRLDLDK